MNQKLINIIKHYKNLRTTDPDRHLIFCEKQDTLESAIYFAALATDDKGKRHGHQRRLKKADLLRYADNLYERINEMRIARTFDELFEIAERSESKGIGHLAIYDTAHRISRFLRLPPARIYLHAGTRAGAKKLLGKLGSRKHLTKSDLPIEFQTADLDEEEIEDILCIYKARF